MRLRLASPLIVCIRVLQAMVQVTMQKPTGAARAMPSGMLRDSEKGIAEIPKPRQVRVHHYE